MDDAVEDGVGERRDADHVVPAVDRNLAGDDQRALVITVFDNFEQIAGLLGRQRLRPPIVQDEQFGAGDRAQKARVTGIAMGDREIGEEPGNAGVKDGDIFPASLVSERASEPALAQAAGAGDEQIAPLGDPIAGGELEEQRPVEPARDLVIDILDAGVMAQACGSGAHFKLFLPAQGRFILEQQTKPFRVIKAARFGIVFDLLEPLGQAVETEGVQLVERRMSEHEVSSQW